MTLTICIIFAFTFLVGSPRGAPPCCAGSGRGMSDFDEDPIPAETAGRGME